MKKILSLMLCMCMLIPLFTFFTYAEDNSETPENVASLATVSVSSSYNDYKPSTAINDGSVAEDGGTTWSPNTPQRDPALEGINPWFNLSFPGNYVVSEISVVMNLPYSNECTVKVEALVNGEWTQIGITDYQSSSAYLTSQSYRNVKFTLAEAVETSQIKVIFSRYTSWDPPCVSECIVMAVPGSGNTVVPDRSEKDTSHHTNIAPEAIPNVFSNYYAYSKAPYLNDNIIDGQINSNGAYEFWRPQTPQRDPSVEGTDAWFTLKFKEYKEISKISLLVELAYSTECIVKYEALVQGEWIEIGTARYSASPVYDNYSRVHNVSITIPETITTKQIRGSVSGYISWDPPMISECFVMGATGEAPEFDVPEGAYLTTNVVLSGYGEASSSKLNSYPALANDDNNLTFWRAKSNANGQWYKVEFDQPYSVNKIGVDLSAIKLVEDEDNKINEAYTFNVKVELLVNGAWTTVHTGELTSSEGSDGLFTKNLDSAVTASAIKITYLETNGNTPVLSELSAITSDGTKCMYIGDIISLHQKLSTAGGNLACYGTPYASSTFTYSNMSDASFINDGMIDKDAGIWVAETSACPAYCGIQLKDKMAVDTVVLYFNDDFGVDKDGDNHVSSFDIQYKNASGSYVTVASGTSFDLTSGQPIVAIKFNPVVTDDIRVVFKTNGGTLPYIKELEIYSHNSNGELFVYSQFLGLPTERCIPTITESFAGYTVAKRPTLFKKYILAMVNALPITHPLKSGVNRWINIG